MSYRRSYTGYVPFSVSVHYPASQNGGTIPYSGRVPVHIVVDVDTDIFDASVIQCNNEVNGLTTAVVATEVAQVEAKRNASRQIASTIVKGFFDYVGADLSQKIKELSSKCESLFVALMGHKENCLAKSKQMQDDYHRISKRYSKIFEDLDKETVSRIEALDKPTFQFADTAQKVVDRNSDTELLGISTIAANENINLETLLACSHVKQQANSLLSSVNDYLRGTYKLTASIRDMLGKSAAAGDISLPVLFVESVASAENKETKIYGTQACYAPSGARVESNLVSQFLSQDVEWQDMDSNGWDKILSYLNAEVQSGHLEDRVVKTMLGLFNIQPIQTIKA